MADRVGQQLGNYRLLRLLGEGGFAEVYLGEQVYLKTRAAIKVLHTRLAQAELESFLSEARTIAGLKHPYIVRVLDFGVEGTTPFLVMDYAPGGTLREHIPKGGRLPLASILPVVRQIADALQYAHDQRLIHRDIKPENMLLDERNQVVLSDFGIATIVQSSHYQHTEGVAGTAAYMAPEQLRGKPRPASDQYSLGIVIYEWLMGTRPFQGSFAEIASQQLFEPPPPLREKLPLLSPAVEQVVLRALKKAPHERFDSIQEFAAALEQASLMELPRHSSTSGTALRTLATPSVHGQPAPQPKPTWQLKPTWLETPLPEQPSTSWRAPSPPVPPPASTMSLAPQPPLHTPPGMSQAQPSRPMRPSVTFSGSVQGPPAAPPAPVPVHPRSQPVWNRRLLIGGLAVVVVIVGLIGLNMVDKGPRGSLGANSPGRTPVSGTPTKPPLGFIQEFSVPVSEPAENGLGGITTGPDGNLWFTQGVDLIGRITPGGKVTQFSLSNEYRPGWITTGPDGNLWFTGGDGYGSIGRITPEGSITELTNAGNSLSDIITGPDGNVWFVDYGTYFGGSAIWRITPQGSLTKFALSNDSRPVDITTGPDGNLWFTESYGNRIGRITPDGKITEFPVPTANSNPWGIAKGVDGNVWFTEEFGHQIGRITPDGKITEFALPNATYFPADITAGPDGNLWFVANNSDHSEGEVGRITPGGNITVFAGPVANIITAGPDGNLWFTVLGLDGHTVGWISPGL